MYHSVLVEMVAYLWALPAILATVEAKSINLVKQLIKYIITKEFWKIKQNHMYKVSKYM